MIEDAHDGGVPILAFSIIEYTVAANHQKIRIPCGKGGGNTHLFRATVAHAVTIRQVKAAHAGKLSVFSDILNPNAQIAAAPIQIKRTHLEYGFISSRIKAAERYEIINQVVQIPGVTE